MQPHIVTILVINFLTCRRLILATGASFTNSFIMEKYTLFLLLVIAPVVAAVVVSVVVLVRLFSGYGLLLACILWGFLYAGLLELGRKDSPTK